MKTRASEDPEKDGDSSDKQLKLKNHPKLSQSSEDEYSVDSEGKLKLDDQGNPVPKFLLDQSGNPVVGADGQPIIKRTKKNVSESGNSDYSLDSEGKVKLDNQGKPINKFIKYSASN